MRNKIIRSVFLTSIWLIFIAVLLQSAGWVLFTFTSIREVGTFGYPHDIWVPHPDLYYLYNPGFEGNFPHAVYYHIPIRINEHGFRDEPFEPLSDDEYRVAVLGDSVVFGSGVRQDERFTELLINHDSTRTDGARVLNLGVNSYTFGHYLALARLSFMDLDPDLVVVGFTLNDIEKMEDVDLVKQFMAGKQRSRPGFGTRIKKAIRRTYGGKFLRVASYNVRIWIKGKKRAREHYTRWMRSAVDYWKQTENREYLHQQLSTFKSQMVKMGIPFVFLVFPELNDLREPDEFGFPRKALITMLKELKIPYCDPYGLFASHDDPESLYLSYDSVHFTPEGHALIRDALMECPHMPRDLFKIR
jgi:lysophospholipase L1-like esterase